MALAHVEATPDLYTPELATIERITPQTEDEKHFLLRLKSGLSLGHLPGQFVEVSVLGMGEAPISITSEPRDDDTFELCLRRAGKVTGALHRLAEGATIGIRGPFGRPFDLERFRGRDVLFVAGGLGLIPLRSLIRTVLANRADYGKVFILYGSKTPSELLFRDELDEWERREDVDLRVTIDRAHPDWDGHVGVVTTLFPDIEINPHKTMAAIVGPPVMFRFTILECTNARIPEQNIVLSLERHMKCGVGKCGHCQINSRYVCLDGPTFVYSEIKRLSEAM
jgi:sulfhydrogenase subunit gamma (sulfur reductase)